MNFSELSDKAAKQSEARAKKFKDYLKSVREENGINTEIQRRLAKAGEKREAELKADMEAQIVSGEKRVRAQIMTEYAEKHGAAEWNGNDDAPFRKLLRGLSGGLK